MALSPTGLWALGRCSTTSTPNSKSPLIAPRWKHWASGVPQALGRSSQPRLSIATDALICLLEEAPFRKRKEIDYLIDRYEALRTAASALIHTMLRL